MKKLIFFSVSVLFLGLATHAYAQGFVGLAPVPGLTDIQPTEGGLAAFFNNLYKFAIGAAAVLAVIMIIWGGLEISTQDSVGNQSAGRDKIRNAILGLVLVLSPVLVFSLINPSILNLSLNLPPIDLKTVPVATPTSCPSGTIGTYPDCKPPCTGSRRTNCNQPPVFNDGPYPSAQAGRWCHGIVPGGGNNFMCYKEKSVCENQYAAEVKNKTATSPCTTF